MEMNKKRHYIVDKATSPNTVNHNIQVINLGWKNGKQNLKKIKQGTYKEKVQNNKRVNQCANLPADMNLQLMPDPFAQLNICLTSI